MTEADWQRLAKIEQQIFENTPPRFSREKARLLALKIMRVLNL